MELGHVEGFDCCGCGSRRCGFELGICSTTACHRRSYPIPKVNMATKIMIGSHLQKMIKTMVGSTLQNMTKKMVHIGSRQQKI
jgi:hypothetical protein